MRRCCGFVGLIVIMASVSGTSSATAAEAPEPPLAFAEPEPLQTTCAKLAAGVNVRIRNETAVRQRVRLVPVEFKSSDTAIARSAVCGGLKIKVPVKLRGGRGATATLRAKKKRRGEFSGSLLLFAAKGRVARREVAIAAKNPSKTLTATPLLDSVSATLDDSVSAAWGDSDRGPIWVPVEGSAADLPRPPKEALSVGAVSGTNGTAAVLYGGRAQLNGSTAKVKLELADGLEPGAYSGTVDLNPADEEEGKVSLELKIADSWVIAAVLLFVGIVLALVVQRWNGRLRPRGRLRGRIKALGKRHDDAVKALITAGGSRDWTRFRIENVESLRKSLDAQLRTATNNAVIEIDKKVLESLESAIAAVEAQIDLLGEIPAHAGDLEEAIQKLEDVHPGAPPLGAPSEKPALIAAAYEALAGGPVKAARLKPRIEEIDARMKQMRILCELEDRLESLIDARKTLNALNNPELAKLDTKLTAIHYLLWTATSAEDLDTAAKEIQDAAKTIAELWHELHQKRQPPAKVLSLASASRPLLATHVAADWQPELLSEETAIVETLEVPPDARSAPRRPARATPEPPSEAPLDSASIDAEVNRARRTQGLAFILAAAVALGSGLIALYAPNETWGSCWDYLAAAIWGLGVQATVSTLATSLDGFAGLSALRRE